MHSKKVIVTPGHSKGAMQLSENAAKDWRERVAGAKNKKNGDSGTNQKIRFR